MSQVYASPTLVLVSKFEAKLLFRGEELSWNVSPFDKAAFSGDFDIFEQINEYWATLPEDQQRRIFEVYKRIRDAFDNLWTAKSLTAALRPLVKELYDEHDLNHLHHWVCFRANVRMPPNLMTAYKESHEMPGTRERTYLRDDYQALVSLTIALRAVFPILGEYIFRTQKENGTQYKEYYASKLLNLSSIWTSAPMEKLRTFVTLSIPQDKSKAAAILDGVSTEDFPDWMLGLVLVRRLSVGDIRGLDPNSTLVTFIFRFIDQKVKTHENSFDLGRINDKNIDSSSSGDESTNLSMLENYKIREEMSTGDITMIEHWTNMPEQIAKRLCPDIDLNLVQEALNSAQALMDQDIQDGQVALAQWVLATQVPARGIMYLNKLTVIKALAVTQAVLWHCGYRELAALSTAYPAPEDGSSPLAPSGSRSRIPKEAIAELNVLYPYARRSGSRRNQQQPPSVAQIAIEEMFDKLAANDWKLSMAPRRIQELTGNAKTPRYMIPNDLRVHLSRMVIAIGSAKAGASPFASPVLTESIGV